MLCYAYFTTIKKYLKEPSYWEFPGSPGVRTWCFHYWGPGSIPGQETKILQVTQCSQKIKSAQLLHRIWPLLQNFDGFSLYVGLCLNLQPYSFCTDLHIVVGLLPCSQESHGLCLTLQ